MGLGGQNSSRPGHLRGPWNQRSDTIHMTFEFGPDCVGGPKGNLCLGTPWWWLKSEIPIGRSCPNSDLSFSKNMFWTFVDFQGPIYVKTIEQIKDSEAKLHIGTSNSIKSLIVMFSLKICIRFVMTNLIIIDFQMQLDGSHKASIQSMLVLVCTHVIPWEWLLSKIAPTAVHNWMKNKVVWSVKWCHEGASENIHFILFHQKHQSEKCIVLVPSRHTNIMFTHLWGHWYSIKQNGGRWAWCWPQSTQLKEFWPIKMNNSAIVRRVTPV